MTANTIAKNAKTVNRYLTDKLKGKPQSLYQAASYLIVNGGKRLRPFMVIKSSQILGGKIKNALPAASAIEMIHNFTLVHDDIMDNDELRHGVQTVHKKFGMPVAILAGDVLFSKAYQVISNSNLPSSSSRQLVSKLAQACVNVCEGQLLDIKMAEGGKIPTQKNYAEMIKKKLQRFLKYHVQWVQFVPELNEKIKKIYLHLAEILELHFKLQMISLEF